MQQVTTMTLRLSKWATASKFMAVSNGKDIERVHNKNGTWVKCYATKRAIISLLLRANEKGESNLCCQISTASFPLVAWWDLLYYIKAMWIDPISAVDLQLSNHFLYALNLLRHIGPEWCTNRSEISLTTCVNIVPYGQLSVLNLLRPRTT